MADINWIKGLIYSGAGVGKTRWLGSAIGDPDTDRVVFLDIEGGIISLQDIPREKYEYKKIGDKVSKVQVLKAFEDEIWKIIAGTPPYKGIKTIAVDGGSELQNRDLEDIVGSKDDIDRDDYRKSTTRLRKLFRTLRDAPFHVLMTALEKKAMDPKTGAVLSVGPALTRALAESTVGFMDFVWNEQIDANNKRVFVTQRSNGVYAKTRDSVEKPMFPKLIKVDEMSFPDVVRLYNGVKK